MIRLTFFLLLGVLLAQPVASRTRFVVMEQSGEWELVKIEESQGYASYGKTPRCYIRSAAQGERPAIYFHPDRRWDMDYPADVTNAANWQQQHLNQTAFPGIYVTFGFRIDDTPEIRSRQLVRPTNIHKRRRMRLESAEMERLYRQIMQGKILQVGWNHANLGREVDALIRQGLGREQPPDSVRYDLAGLSGLNARFDTHCPRSHWDR